MNLARLLPLVAALAACAEDARPPAAPTRTAAPVRAAAPKPAATAPVLSESKFLGALYTAIAKRTPSESAAGEGEVTASFQVNAQGKSAPGMKRGSLSHSSLVRTSMSAGQ